MAAPTSLDGMVAKNGGKGDDLAEFETRVDEEEALAELEDLLPSDDEFFVEVDAESTERNEDKDLVSERTEETMSCSKCGKVYKKKFYLSKHEENCTATGTPGSIPKRKKISPQTDTSSTSVGKWWILFLLFTWHYIYKYNNRCLACSSLGQLLSIGL